MSPKVLAKELGISPKTLRAWLRREHERPDAQKNTEWVLGPAVVEAARSHFA